ncbi:D-alanyl-D-alanine carboxypeptidase (penicillin-binding protein 5/6) [Cognatiyoonia sediminum]|uniref:serine-type D-Ala-D-Ala carboxypeptidase n=1 Tax=Cognatiyoonia sediminum TaxID=1508389 RepID=A0A1M5MXU3_9RHOB|nr:D-alanyl-D-alanine carboxypeptidase family protein [Cognatiyoonia sediminum]SHG81729.1 D-alanyl-D-alanine carboxypeptidase (penicillin-binding protein 5/6) [Cognatiyoonia sediminum]
MPRLTRLVISSIAIGLLWAVSAAAQAFDTKATAAYVLDQTTGTVLMSKNADEPLPPASMSKLMTIYMAFEAVADGRLGITERLPVSEHAATYGGSTMFLDTTDRVSVEDLLRGVIVLSGNDASAVLGEAIGGTEPAFARMMTERAQQMGLTNSTFKNSNGWPAVGHRMSMRDLGVLADRLITDFPTYYPLFNEQTFAFDGRAPANSNNRNPLLGLGIGADGLKTGHTQEAGYGLVGSAKQGDRRVIFVLTGLDSEAERAEEAEKIVNWAFRQFAQKDVVRAGSQIAHADVWMGDAPTVGLTVAEDLSLLLPVINQDAVDAQVVYDGPLQAPISAGERVGDLIISVDGLPDTTVPLVATDDVAEGGFETRLRVAAQVLLEKIGALGAEDNPA